MRLCTCGKRPTLDKRDYLQGKKFQVTCACGNVGPEGISLISSSDDWARKGAIRAWNAMHIAPFIGASVWFYSHPLDEICRDKGKPLAATIAAINPDGTVNLGILDTNGNARTACNVPIIRKTDRNKPISYAVFPD